jgi:hypothetical protein
MEETFDDVSVGGASTRMLRRRLNDSERANYGDATGREVWLYDIEGYLCTATVADLWRVREEWAEPDDDGNTNEANRELVTASLLPTEGDCSGALYATPASRARGNAVFFAEVKAPEASLSARALEAFVGLAEYTQIQDDYGRGEWQPDAGGAAIPGRGAWTAHSDSGSSVTQFTDGSGRTLVRVAAWAGVGCGDFRADLWAVWERTPSGLALRAVSQGEVGAAFLLERGGRLSFGSESQLNTASGNHWAVSFTPLEPWSCPC